MEFNYLAVFVAALIPMVLGFVWYNPKVLGTAWMKETGMTEDKMKNSNMGVIFGLSFVLALVLAFFTQTIVLHEIGAFGMVGGDTSSATYQAFMAEHAGTFRYFGHGALHGALAGIFLVLPIMGTNGLFERKSWKLTFINVGYWTVCLALMGGVLSAWQ